MRAAFLVVGAALVATAGAQAAPRYVSLPSPVAPLSTSPPVGGGATAFSERIRHRVAAATRVETLLDSDGKPFAVVATQRLGVRVKGDYFFTIGAPLLDVEAAPGSESTPGLRATSILWTGFNPGRRTLAARATLDPSAVAPSLPLRVEVADGRTTLVNTTGIDAAGYAADATRAPLVAYLMRLRADLAAGRTPLAGAATATSKPASTRLRVGVPLLVRGTVAGGAVHATVRDRLVVPATGAVRLTVEPDTHARFGDLTRLSGRALLHLATSASLQAARARQYETFLGNPDPAGHSETTYVYRTAARPEAPVAATPVSHRGRSWTATLAWLGAFAAGAVVALVAWTRA
jgi:hypothetical protein